MFNDEKDPVAAIPDEGSAERITFDAVCRCADTYGDNPWCPACYPELGTCDAGDCDELAVGYVYDAAHGRLPACARHLAAEVS